jgi:hypothetical protein
MKTTGKRLKVAYISDLFIEEILKGNTEDIKPAKEIPKDATVHNIYYDENRCCFAIVIEHKSFRVLKEAEVVPMY